MGDFAVQIDHVSRRYGSGDDLVVALGDVSFAVELAEAVAITGPSGSGKTTLMNLIAGLDRPSEGDVRVLGQVLAWMSDAQLTRFRAQSVGLVFQDPNLLPGLTALENVAIARLPWGRSREVEARARDLLAAVGLGDRLDHPPGRLSGGERQRVGIARALVGEPRVLLADEPTGNLDRATTAELLRLLDTIRREMGLTLLIATHDPLVTAIADRVVDLATKDARENASVLKARG